MGAVGAVNDMAGTKHLEMVGALRALAEVIDNAKHIKQPFVADAAGLSLSGNAETINAIRDTLVALNLMESA